MIRTEVPLGPRPIARFHPRRSGGPHITRRGFLGLAAIATGAVLTGAWASNPKGASELVAKGLDAVREIIDPAVMLYGRPIKFDISQKVPRTDENGHVLFANPTDEPEILRIQPRPYSPTESNTITFRTNSPSTASKEKEFSPSGTITTGRTPRPLAQHTYGIAVAGKDVTGETLHQARSFIAKNPHGKETKISVWYLIVDRSGNPVNPATNQSEVVDGALQHYYISDVQTRIEGFQPLNRPKSL